MENRLRIAAACLLAGAFVVAGGPVWAGGGGGVPPIGGENHRACGKWVLKLARFGKMKIRDYNNYVPEIYQASPGSRLKPSVIVFFRVDNTFTMGIPIPNQTGVVANALVTGTYTQKGKKLKFELDAAGEDALELAFGALAKNNLFGTLDRVTSIPYADLDLGSLKFKGRINDNGRFKIKLKTRLEYDIQYQNNSEVPDDFGAKGVLKLRTRSRDCDD